MMVTFTQLLLYRPVANFEIHPNYQLNLKWENLSLNCYIVESTEHTNQHASVCCDEGQVFDPQQVNVLSFNTYWLLEYTGPLSEIIMVHHWTHTCFLRVENTLLHYNSSRFFYLTSSLSVYVLSQNAALIQRLLKGECIGRIS